MSRDRLRNRTRYPETASESCSPSSPPRENQYFLDPPQRVADRGPFAASACSHKKTGNHGHGCRDSAGRSSSLTVPHVDGFITERYPLSAVIRQATHCSPIMSSPQPVLQEKVRPTAFPLLVTAYEPCHSSKQPSIYPSPHAPITLIESPPPLAAHVRVAREAVTDVLGDAKVQINKGVDKWVKWERVVERESWPVLHWFLIRNSNIFISTVIGEVKSVIPKDEPLTPGILYIGVAGLAGSVLARNRMSKRRFSRRSFTNEVSLAACLGQ